jgi:hypothetical protein
VTVSGPIRLGSVAIPDDPKRPSAWHVRGRRAYDGWRADGPATDFEREALRLELYARRRNEGHIALKDRYRVLYYLLSATAVFLAAVAGSSAVLGLSKNLIAITAFVSAVLSGLVGTIKPEQGRQQQSERVAAYNELVGNIRVYQVEVAEMSDAAKAAGLTELIRQLREVEARDAD